MFVAKYPAWATRVSFDDGTVAYFDGPKDMFKYLFNLQKYRPGHSREEVATILVTGYYDLRPLDAEDAHFVTGSDVYGPMGHELVPLASAEDAEEFRRDHRGDRILRLEDISPETMDELD